MCESKNSPQQNPSNTNSQNNDEHEKVVFDDMGFPERERPKSLSELLRFCKNRLGKNADFGYWDDKGFPACTYYKAFLGILGDGILAYDADEMIAQCAEDCDMSYEEAMEALDYNTFCCYMGPQTPKHITPVKFPENPEEEFKEMEGDMLTYIPDCDNALVGFMETPTGLCCVYNMKLLPDAVKNCKYMRRDLLLDPYEKIPFDRKALKKKLEAAKAKKAKKKAKKKH